MVGSWWGTKAFQGGEKNAMEKGNGKKPGFI